MRLGHQSGLIGGTYYAAPGVSRPFSGIVIQKQNKAFGYLLHNGESSAVTLTPQP